MIGGYTAAKRCMIAIAVCRNLVVKRAEWVLCGHVEWCVRGVSGVGRGCDLENFAIAVRRNLVMRGVVARRVLRGHVEWL